jgi:hypothetical protein
MPVSVADSLTLSDVNSATANFVASLADSITPTDAATATAVFVASLSDALICSDGSECAGELLVRRRRQRSVFGHAKHWVGF